MKKHIQLILILFLAYNLSAQSNCECVLCKVPCNSPSSAHKNPQCPVYIAAHKNAGSASASSGGQMNNLNTINSLLNVITAPSTQPAPANTTGKKQSEGLYDPMEEALKSTKNKVEKINDPDVVDLSDLKDPYSAKVDASTLKEIKKTDETDEICNRAFQYKKNRLTALNNLLANCQTLVSQQEKSVLNAQSEIQKWNQTGGEIIADEIKGILEDKISDVLSKQKELANMAGNVTTLNNETWKTANRVADATQLKTDDMDLVNFCNYVVAGLNTASNYADLNPALKSAIDASPAKWVKMAVDYGPKLVDALSLAYVQKELNNQNKKLTEEKLKSDLLNSKIQSWQQEKKELDECSDNDCNCIRAIILKRRPDLRE